MTALDAIAAATRLLSGKSGSPRLDAELLMAAAMGVDRNAMLLRFMDAEAPPAFDTLVQRRLSGEPIAYILGKRDFWTISLKVGPGVLVPRPDTETLMEAALAHFGPAGPRTVLDLGTGPGTLLLACLSQWPEASGVGVDKSMTALAYARENARALGMSGRADLRQGDWTEGLDGPFDLIMCNPPYVERDAVLPDDVRDWEPGEALFAGMDGLDDYRRLAPLIVPLIAPGGIACIEVGAGQAGAVAALFEAEGVIARSRKDLNGHDRCIEVTA